MPGRNGAQGRSEDTNYLFLCVCKEGTRTRWRKRWLGPRGYGVACIFFILGISALEGLGGAVKSHASRSRDLQGVIAILSS